jgi:Ca2+-binding RTX toxin-like protein
LTGLATFAADGTEQDALAEYLATFFPADDDPTTPVYGEADQGRNLDERIQNLNVREDAVFPVVVIPGTGGGDNLEGTEGDDIIDGGEGPDRLFGNAGDDNLIGGEGPDRIDGGPGDDIIDGGSGPSKLTGGEGSDTFVLNPGPGFARISDFEVGTDFLALPNMGTLGIASGSSFKDLDLRISGNAKAGARIRFDSDLVAVLEGVDPRMLKGMEFEQLFNTSHSFMTILPDVLA